MEKTPRDAGYIPPEIEDFSNQPYHTLLKVLERSAPEHVQQHLIHIENNAYNQDQATAYLQEVLATRAEALTETVISDSGLERRLQDPELKAFVIKQIETDIRTNPEHFVGSGMTAHVMQFYIEDTETGDRLPLAVKYLDTPTKMTLSASAEHDMLVEVERIQKIESLEASADLKFIKVPHPYFHHQNSEMQCYGMELIDGFDLSKDLITMPDGQDKENLVRSLAAIDFVKIEKEIETFFARMHDYCIHGDIKPANLMVGKSGQFYVIDFGQSRLISDISDKAQDQLYTLREDEVKYTKDSIRKIISDAKELVAEY